MVIEEMIEVNNIQFSVINNIQFPMVIAEMIEVNNIQFSVINNIQQSNGNSRDD